MPRLDQGTAGPVGALGGGSVLAGTEYPCNKPPECSGWARWVSPRAVPFVTLCDDLHCHRCTWTFGHTDKQTQQSRHHARVSGGWTGSSPGRRTQGAVETGVLQGQQLKGAFVLETCP